MAKVAKLTPTEIPPTMRPEIFTFRAIGTSPLLQNNPEKFIGVAEAPGLLAKKKYDDAEEARLRLYVNDDGLFYHPTQAFIRAAMRAVTGRKFGKVIATHAIRGGVFVAEAQSIILSHEGKPATKYAIDRQSVIVGKARVLRCRPRFDEWMIDVALDVDTAVIGQDQVRDALRLAGRTIGIGDFRPEKGGGFGRFRID